MTVSTVDVDVDVDVDSEGKEGSGRPRQGSMGRMTVVTGMTAYQGKEPRSKAVIICHHLGPVDPDPDPNSGRITVKDGFVC